MIEYPPLNNDSSKEICKKIQTNSNISKEAVDILKKLINDPEKRLKETEQKKWKNILILKSNLEKC